MSLLGYHGFNNWENHFMEDENERDNILFGFELEAREDDSNYVENQLSPEQVACKLGEEFGNLFVYERDSSIGRGVEIISQPMTMNYYMAHIDLFKKLLKMLDKMNYVSTKGNKCGLHIHFNRKALGYNSKEFAIPEKKGRKPYEENKIRMDQPVYAGCIGIDNLYAFRCGICCIGLFVYPGFIYSSDRSLRHGCLPWYRLLPGRDRRST